MFIIFLALVRCSIGHILGLLVKMPTRVRNSLHALSRTIQPCCTVMQTDAIPVIPWRFCKTQIYYNLGLKIPHLIWSALYRHRHSPSSQALNKSSVASAAISSWDHKLFADLCYPKHICKTMEMHVYTFLLSMHRDRDSDEIEIQTMTLALKLIVV